MRTFSYEDSISFLKAFLETGKDFSFDAGKRSLFYEDDEGAGFRFTLPLATPVDEDSQENLKNLDDIPPSFLIILIRSGACALGWIEDGEIIRHKVIKTYMVRKKQGKSQVKHLNQKGKSRLGSRIRLRNTVNFFEDINETLADWDVCDQAELILLSVPVNLKNLFYSSKIAPPFEKRDPRLRKIPVDVKTPGVKELERVLYLSLRGTLEETEGES